MAESDDLEKILNSESDEEKEKEKEEMSNSDKEEELGDDDEEEEEEVEIQTSSDDERVHEEDGETTVDSADVFKCGICNSIDRNQVMLVHYGCNRQVFCCECRDGLLERLSFLRSATEGQKKIAPCATCAENVNPQCIHWSPNLQDRFYAISAIKCPLCEQPQPFQDIQHHIEDCTTVENRTYTKEAMQLVKRFKMHARRIAKYRTQLTNYLSAKEQDQECEDELKRLLKKRRRARVMELTSATSSGTSSASSSLSVHYKKRQKRPKPVDMSQLLRLVAESDASQTLAPL